MKYSNIKKLNAISLLFIFSLNIIVGFLCSVDFDLGFNRDHHQRGTETHVHSHNHSKDHHHNEQTTVNQTPHKDKENCCKDEVVKFVKIDKQAPQLVKLHFPIIVFLKPFHLPFDAGIRSVYKPNNWYFVSCHHPPIRDIRIAIQSFQI